MTLLLASTSAFRRALLERLQLPFVCVPPGVDETPRRGETADALVARLAYAKAQAVGLQYPEDIVIGSDQVAATEDTVLGKPGDHAHARAQLQQLSGKLVRFHTGLCVLRVRSGRHHTHTDITRVQFRKLADDEIERYLHAEQPYECAGSFKCEGLGISLFERIESEDPTALIGLPMIALCRFLRLMGAPVP